MQDRSISEQRVSAYATEAYHLLTIAIMDDISVIRGEGSIVPELEIPANKKYWQIGRVDNRLTDLFEEDNQDGNVTVSVMTGEVRILNKKTMTSLHIASTKPMLWLIGGLPSPTREAAKTFLDNLEWDRQQNPASRPYHLREELFADYKNAHNLINHVAYFMKRPDLARQLANK